MEDYLQCLGAGETDPVLILFFAILQVQEYDFYSDAHTDFRD
jgi:hypothetical protein